MRRFLSIFLLSIYMITTSGLIVQLHFCQDELMDFAIASKVDNCCGTVDDCFTNEEDSCCKDDVVKLKINNEQNSVSKTFLQQIVECDDVHTLVHHYYHYTLPLDILYKNPLGFGKASNAPPGEVFLPPLYIRHQSLILHHC